MSQPPANSALTPILCYVTDRKSLPSAFSADQQAALLRQITAAAAAGVDWIQIREKDLSGREISKVTREALAQSRLANASTGHVTRIIVNDRLDVAISEQADGVHLGENSLPVRDVRRWLDANSKRLVAVDRPFLLGVSCHSLEAAICAEREGANYIFFGPIFPTPSKAVYGAPQGLTTLNEVCRALSIPVLAIGGITVENKSACLAAEAAGIAAIRLFQLDDITDAVAEPRPLR